MAAIRRVSAAVALAHEHVERLLDEPRVIAPHIGVQLVEVDPGRIVMDYTVREEMANPAGLLHGGVQCAMLDDVIGLAAFTLGRDGFHLSINLATDYLGSVAVGSTVRATGVIARAGNRIVHASGELATVDDGRAIARGASNLLWSPHTGTTI